MGAFDKRVEEADKIRKKHADRIPVICERADGSDIAEIDRKKYLVPQELTVGQFVYVVRKRLKLPPEKAIFIFVNGVLPSTGGDPIPLHYTPALCSQTSQLTTFVSCAAALMSQMYKDYKDP